MRIGDFEVLVGADPEVFVTKNGKLDCAHNLIPGTKEQPYKVEDGAVQVDGMALEFNIDPAKDLESFVANIDSVYSQLAAMVPEHELLPEAVADFGAEMMEAAPDEAKELGCEPDFNAWDEGRENPRPNAEVDYRTGAGHIHIGWTQGKDVNDAQHIDACMMLVRQLDYYLGVPSVILDPDDRRRNLYGKAGAFRVKPYGVEYRVLSNFWLKSKELKEWVYKNAMLAFKKLVDGEVVLNGSPMNVINFSAKHLAKVYINHYRLPALPVKAKKKNRSLQDVREEFFAQPVRPRQIVWDDIRPMDAPWQVMQEWMEG